MMDNGRPILRADGSVHVEEPAEEKCPTGHANTQEIQGAGPCALRIVCVDCGEEL